MLSRGFHANQVGGRPIRLLVAVLAVMGAIVLHEAPAFADSRSSLVLVSVQVVASCRIENTVSQTNDAMDLKMRCNSTARPNIGLMNGSQVLGPVGTVTLAHSQIATTENGKTLSIEF